MVHSRRGLSHCSCSLLSLNANVNVHLQEVALCGHATLAASQAVFSINPAFETIEFTTRFSGVLTARQVEGKQVQITLPSLPQNVLETFGGKCSKDDLRKVGSVFGVKEEEIVAVSPFAFGTRSSVIVSLSPEVDLAKVEASEADLVSQSCIGSLYLANPPVPCSWPFPTA